MRFFLALLFACEISSFQPLPTFRRASSSLQAFPPPKPPADSSSGGPTGDFLDGFGKKESAGMQKAREYMSDESLPISFDSTDSGDEDEDDEDSESSPVVEPVVDEPAVGEPAAAVEVTSEVEAPNGKKQAGELTLSNGSVMMEGQEFFEEPSEELLRNNPYLKVVSTLTPSDIISKFTTTAHPRVQNAVRSTILGLIGSLPKMAFDTTTITTGQRLASLMFQLQMTGYLFKNAEYRLSLSQSLGSLSDMPALAGSATAAASALTLANAVHDDDEDDDDDEDYIDPLKGKVLGKLKIRYGPESTNGDAENGGQELEVDAAAYMSELRTEVSQLRDELTSRRKEKEEAMRKDLLLYIRTLPEQQLRSLTGTVSQDVLLAMKGLVNVVMAGIGEGQIAAETVTEQSGEAMAQLCMWQLVIGYNLRELEVREEMKNSLLGSFSSGQQSDGADFSEPGAFD